VSFIEFQNQFIHTEIFKIMKKIILFAFVFCLLFPVKAQDRGEKIVLKEQNPTVAIAIVPGSFIDNIAEFNLDLRLTDRQWLTIGPCFQFGQNNDYYYNAIDAIKSGFGLKCNYRYFPLTRLFNDFSDGRGPFISAGLRGQTTTYEYTGNSYNNYTDMYDNQVLTPGSEPFVDKVAQIGFDVNIGYTHRFLDILFVEGYLGIGTRYSNYEYDASRGLDLGSYSGDTGFTGYCFNGGLRLGIFLNRFARN